MTQYVCNDCVPSNWIASIAKIFGIRNVRHKLSHDQGLCSLCGKFSHAGYLVRAKSINDFWCQDLCKIQIEILGEAFIDPQLDLPGIDCNSHPA